MCFKNSEFVLSKTSKLYMSIQQSTRNLVLHNYPAQFYKHFNLLQLFQPITKVEKSKHFIDWLKQQQKVKITCFPTDYCMQVLTLVVQMFLTEIWNGCQDSFELTETKKNYLHVECHFLKPKIRYENLYRTSSCQKQHK